MRNLIIFTILVLLLQGCLWVNKRGISDKYYNGCKEHYDASGVYHKKCDENLIDWKDL